VGYNEKFGYGYDLAGNLSCRSNNALYEIFSANNLNELSSESRGGYFTAAGTTTSPATNVTVNSSNAIRYADNTFARTNIGLADGTNTFTAIAKDNLGRIDTNIVTAYLPGTVTFQCDANGNLTNDGLRSFVYDDENQLISVSVANSFKSEFSYDGKMRRRIRREYAWQLGAWRMTNEVRYVYDRKLVIQERNANNLPQVVYTRGRDLSGSLEGAGGIGGLLARSDQSTVNSQETTSFYHTDANGNITMLISSLQLDVARYIYGPFGNTLSASGPVADANVYRFSSKELHPGSGLAYFLFRYYASDFQRWANRDPWADWAFRFRSKRTTGKRPAQMNLFTFVRNEPNGRHDNWGLKCYLMSNGMVYDSKKDQVVFWSSDPVATQNFIKDCNTPWYFLFLGVCRRRWRWRRRRWKKDGGLLLYGRRRNRLLL